MKRHSCIGLLAFALGSCGPPHQPQQPARNASSPVLPASSAPPAVTNSPAPREPRANRASSTDPKSIDAALEIAHKFADLLNRRKFDEAYTLLGSGDGFSSAAEFREYFARYADLHVTILDSPAPSPEGAAGSIYLTIRGKIAGTFEGSAFDRPTKIILRRVNDVPGSTEAQRKWHVERFDDLPAL